MFDRTNDGFDEFLRPFDNDIGVDEDEDVAVRGSRAMVAPDGNVFTRVRVPFENNIGIRSRDPDRAVGASAIAHDDFEIVLPPQLVRELAERATNARFLL